MSDGVREKIAISSDGFGRAIAKIAAAQLCEKLGFRRAQSCVLDALSDVVVKYICDLGKSAKLYANTSGRVEANAFDVVRALEDISAYCGFSGAAELDHCAAGSGVIRDIGRYAGSEEEVPFAQSVPRFPLRREREGPRNFTRMWEGPPWEHVPAWLPAFPDPHTYVYTRAPGEVMERKIDKLGQAKQRRRAERSLLNLERRLAGIESATPVATMDAGMSERHSNQFLAPPLPFGERRASVVGTKLAVVEPFAPVIEAVRNENPELGEGERDALPRNRSAVRFKLGFDKRTLTPAVSLTPVGAGCAELWVLRDDEKNDKKRRAELILRESMENPHELFKL